MNPIFKITTLTGLALSFLAAGTSHSQEIANRWDTPLVSERGQDADPETLEQTLGHGLSHELVETNPTFDQASAGKVQILTFRRPKDFDYEFSVLVVDGKVRRTFIVSTAMPGKAPILGIHRLSVMKQGSRPWPWITSHTYGNSPMYWGLNIRGGFFIHSSPHYGNLGRPASMGCVRTSIPDAMEVFNTIANENAGSPAYSMVYDGFSLAIDTPQARFLKQVLSNSGMSVEDLKAGIALSKREVESVSNGDLEFSHGVPVDAHARPFLNQQSEESLFPKCGGANCWDVFGKRRTTIRLNDYARTGVAPVYTVLNSAAPVALASGTRVELNTILSGGLQSMTANKLYDIALTMKSGSAPLLVRVCDVSVNKCSRARGPEANQSGVSVYPMYQIAGDLRSSVSLVLDIQGGSGTLQSAKVRYAP